MGSGSSMDQKGVKRMLLIFGVLAILGVVTLAVSVLLGVIVLAVAEVFFLMAYRRFSRLPRPAK